MRQGRGSTIVVISAALLGAVPADASASPVVALTVPVQVSAGSPVSFSWSATRVPRRARIEVQDQVGIRHVWKRLLRLSGSHGTGILPAHSLGKYPVRLLVVGQRNQVLAERNATPDVFGKVPLGDLLGKEAQTYTTSSFSFSYVGRAQADKYNREGTAWTISAARNHCRSVQLYFPVGDAAGTTTEQLSGTVSLVQESAVPVAVAVTSVPPTMYSLETAIVPGQSWSVDLSIASEDSSGLILYASFNGVASCDSSEVEI
jgi:hypothetical protein